MVKMVIGEEQSRRVTSEKATDTIRLLKEVDNVYINGKVFKYSDCGLELSSNDIICDTLVVALEEI